jgi:hypothetical protein
VCVRQCVKSVSEWVGEETEIVCSDTETTGNENKRNRGEKRKMKLLLDCFPSLTLPALALFTLS